MSSWCLLRSFESRLKRAAGLFRARNAGAWRAPRRTPAGRASALDRRGPQQPRIRLPGRQRCRNPGLRPAARSPTRCSRIGLQWRYWSFRNSMRVAGLRERVRRRLAVEHDQSRPTAPTARSPWTPRSRSGRRVAPDRAQLDRRRSAARRLAPSAPRARRRSFGPSTPSATRIAMRRVSMPSLPGRATATAPAETSTSGLAGGLRGCGSGSGSSSMPSPSATACASSSATLRSCAHHALAHGGDLHLGQLEAERADDVLLLDRRSGCSRTAWPGCSARRTSPACRGPCPPRPAAGRT